MSKPNRKKKDLLTVDDYLGWVGNTAAGATLLEWGLSVAVEMPFSSFILLQFMLVAREVGEGGRFWRWFSSSKKQW